MVRKMIYNVEIEEKNVVLNVEGRLDALSMETFTKAMESCIQPGMESLTLDLDKVEYISSGGLRVIMNSVKNCQANQQKLRIIHVQPNVYSIFVLTGFQNFIEITQKD